jgi:hypothetical protein
MFQVSSETYQNLQSEDQSINAENSCCLFLQKKKKNRCVRTRGLMNVKADGTYSYCLTSF